MLFFFIISALSISQTRNKIPRKSILERRRNRFSANNKISALPILDNHNINLVEKAKELLSNNKSLNLLKTIFLNNDDDCSLCQLAMPIVVSWLQNERNVDTIVVQVESLCVYVDESVRDICLQMVSDYVPPVVNYFTQQLAENDVCAVLGIC